MARLKTIKPLVAKLPPRIATPREIRDKSYSVDANTRRQYGNSRWGTTRTAILTRDLWHCRMCGVLLRGGRSDSAAALIDHMRPAKLRPDLFYAHDNLIAVCRQCHATTCDKIERKHWPDDEAIYQAKVALAKPSPLFGLAGKV